VLKEPEDRGVGVGEIERVQVLGCCQSWAHLHEMRSEMGGKGWGELGREERDGQ